MLLTEKEILSELDLDKDRLKKLDARIVTFKKSGAKYYDKEEVERLINNDSYVIKYNEGKPYVTFKDIDDNLNVDITSVRNRIYYSSKWKVNIDYFRMDGTRALAMGLTTKYACRGLFGIYYSGYKKIVKDSETNEEVEERLFGKNRLSDLKRKEEDIKNTYKIKRYKGRPFITTTEICSEFGININTLRSIMRKKCVENRDFIKIPAEIARKEGWSNAKNNNYIMGIYKSGYCKIIKADENNKELENILFGEDDNSDVCIQQPAEVEIAAKNVNETEPEKSEKEEKPVSIDSISTIIDVLVKDREVYKEMVKQQGEQINLLVGLVYSAIENIKTENPSINKELIETEKTGTDTVEVVTDENSIQKTWYNDINELTNNIGSVTGLDKNAILSQAYKILNSQYGFCTEQYKKEYQEIVGKKPNTLSTIFWVETERNIATRGLLAGILDTMLKEAIDNHGLYRA